MGAEDAGRPAGGDAGTGEAAVAVLLGAGALAWRVADRVTAPARWLVGGIAGALVRPVAAGPTAAQGRALRAQWAVLLARTAGHVAREVVAVVLPALDLTALVLKHVDLDRIAAALDLDAAVARVDLDAAVARVDLDAAVARVDIGAIVDRIDLDAVAARIDADRVVARVDLDAVVARLDLVGIAQSVIDAIDLPEIVRESTGALSSDAVRAVRAESRRADDRVAGLFDRLLRRGPYPDGPPAGAPALP